MRYSTRLEKHRTMEDNMFYLIETTAYNYPIQPGKPLIGLDTVAAIPYNGSFTCGIYGVTE